MFWYMCVYVEVYIFKRILLYKFWGPCFSLKHRDPKTRVSHFSFNVWMFIKIIKIFTLPFKKKSFQLFRIHHCHLKALLSVKPFTPTIFYNFSNPTIFRQLFFQFGLYYDFRFSIFWHKRSFFSFILCYVTQ